MPEYLCTSSLDKAVSSLINSRYPTIVVRGVLKSWATFVINSFFCLSALRSISNAALSFSFSFSLSFSFASNVFDKTLMFAAREPNSSSYSTSHCTP